MRNKINAYALHFTSFLVEGGIEPKKVILFGSAVPGKFDKESDVDIFVDTKKTVPRENTISCSRYRSGE